jgi:hypothetical protein
MLKFLSHVFLVAGFVILSLKPSMVNRIQASYIHPHHVAFSQFSSIEKRKPLSSPGSFYRSSFQKNEDKSHLTVLAVVVPSPAGMFFRDLSVDLMVTKNPRLAAFIPSDTVVLRI